MKSLQDFRSETGEFTFPDYMEMIDTAKRIDDSIETMLRAIDTAGVKGLLVRTARLDLASQALTEGDGYTRNIKTFKDLTRAELHYIEAWIASTGIEQGLAKHGWKGTKPTPKRVIQMIKTGKVADRTSSELIERFISS